MRSPAGDARADFRPAPESAVDVPAGSTLWLRFDAAGEPASTRILRIAATAGDENLDAPPITFAPCSWGYTFYYVP